MLEAQITKTAILEDQKTGKTNLLGVAEYFGDCINFKMEYDWDTLDVPWFLNELKEVLAQGFDLPLKRVDIREPELLGKMKKYSEWHKQGKVGQA